jgi:hypothetical protein
MIKQKIIIKILTYSILTFSLYNLYNLRDSFKKIKLPLKPGTAIITTPTLDEPGDGTDSLNIQLPTLKYTEDYENFYTYKNTYPNGDGHLKPFYIEQYSQKSIIMWSNTLLRWIKIGDLSSITDSELMTETKEEITNTINDYEGVGLNLGCVLGNNKHDVTNCKVWKKNFGIGIQNTVSVKIIDITSLETLRKTKSSLKNEQIDRNIPFVIIFFVLILILIIYISLTYKK